MFATGLALAQTGNTTGLAALAEESLASRPGSALAPGHSNLLTSCLHVVLVELPEHCTAGHTAACPCKWSALAACQALATLASMLMPCSMSALAQLAPSLLNCLELDLTKRTALLPGQPMRCKVHLLEEGVRVRVVAGLFDAIAVHIEERDQGQGMSHLASVVLRGVSYGVLGT
jgi:hypothetical protein